MVVRKLSVYHLSTLNILISALFSLYTAFLMLLFGSSAWILALSVKAQQSGVLVRDLEQVRC